MTFKMIKTALQKKESPGFHPSYGCPLHCIPACSLLQSFCPTAGGCSVHSDRPRQGQEAKDDFFPMRTALQLPTASDTSAALCREEFALHLLEGNSKNLCQR